MVFTRDPFGRLIPPGRVRKELVWECWNDSVLPSWLTSDQGTLTFPVPVNASGQGVVRATTAATAGSKANVKAAFPVDLSVFAAVMFTVEGLNFDVGTGIDAEVSMYGAAGVGIALEELDGASGGATFNINGTTSKNAMVYSGDASSPSLRVAGRKNLTLAASSLSGHCAIFADDQEIDYRTVSSLTSGAVTPKVEITTKSAAAHYFQVGVVRLVLFY